MINRAHRITGVSLSAKKLQLKENRVLLLGLDGSGKTTLLYKLKLGENITTIPTIGFNVETLDRDIVMWDVGGQQKIRPLWRHYFQATNTLMWAVDASDAALLQESASELLKVLVDGDEELMAVRIVIVATKQDVVGALTPEDVWGAMVGYEPALTACVSPRQHFVIGFSIQNPDYVAVYNALQGIEMESKAGTSAKRWKDSSAAAGAAAGGGGGNEGHQETLPSIVSRYMHAQLEYVQKQAEEQLVAEQQLVVSVSGVRFPSDLFLHVLSFLEVKDLLPSFASIYGACDENNTDGDASDGAVIFVSKAFAWCGIDAASKQILRTIFSLKSAKRVCKDDMYALTSVNSRLRTVLYLSLPFALRRAHARLCAVLIYKLLVANENQDTLQELLCPSGGIGSLFPLGGDGSESTTTSYPYEDVLPLAAFLCFADETELSCRFDNKTFVESILRQCTLELGGSSDGMYLFLPLIQRLQLAARDGIHLVLLNDADENRPVLDVLALKGIELETEQIERCLVLSPGLKGDIMSDLVNSGKYCKLVVSDEKFLATSMASLINVAKVITGETPSYCREFEFNFTKSILSMMPVLRRAIAHAAPQVRRIVLNTPSGTPHLDDMAALCSKRFPNVAVSSGRTVTFSE